MSVQDELYKKIKEEIANDPDSVGYAGKTDKEIQDLMNAPIRGTQVVETYKEPPIMRVINGLVGIQNIVSEEEITDAKKAL